MIRMYASAAVAKSTDGRVGLMIGLMFYICAFALSSGVPSVDLGWAHKSPGLMELVGLDGNALIHTEFVQKHVMELPDKT